MGYRDPREALQAENEALRQQLREAQDEVAALRGPGARASADEVERQRWALGMRCLGGVALMMPFLFMSALCERRVAHRPASTWSATMVPHGQVLQLPPGHPPVAPMALAPSHFGGCRMAAPALGFENFTRAVERSARVTRTEGLAGVGVGDACTVRVVPVSMREFNCHVEVVCAGQTVYGALPTGYAHCDVEGSQAVRAMDADYTLTDGDARMSVDFTQQRVLVEDRHGDTTRVAELRLDAAP